MLTDTCDYIVSKSKIRAKDTSAYTISPREYEKIPYDMHSERSRRTEAKEVYVRQVCFCPLSFEHER